MRWLKKVLTIVALSTGILLVGSGVASAADTGGPTAPHQGKATGADVVAAAEWKWAGFYSSDITCNLEGASRVVFTTADDWTCIPPGPGGTQWDLWLYYE